MNNPAACCEVFHLMIATYDGLKKWVRFGGIIAISLIQVIWGLNIYANCKWNMEKQFVSAAQ